MLHPVTQLIADHITVRSTRQNMPYTFNYRDLDLHKNDETDSVLPMIPALDAIGITSSNQGPHALQCGFAEPSKTFKLEQAGVAST